MLEAFPLVLRWHKSPHTRWKMRLYISRRHAHLPHLSRRNIWNRRRRRPRRLEGRKRSHLSHLLVEEEA
jgi:hypothetical protein